MTFGAVDGLLAYDGLWDPGSPAGCWRPIRTGRTVGEVRFVPEPGAQIADGPQGRVLGVEQSNTSVCWGEQSILKLFRRVLPGVNPDLELHRALRAVGSEQVASLQGAIEGTLAGEPVTLAMLQDYAANSAEGWAMALASVRDLLAEGDLRADEVGGDFAAESAPARRDHRRGARRAAAGAGRLRAGSRAAGRGLAPAARRGDRRGPRAGRLQRAASGPSTSGWPSSAARCRPSACTATCTSGRRCAPRYGWLVIDFEGEPAAAFADRVRPDSALRDVAGMLRSFDYAAYHQLSHVRSRPASGPTRTTPRSWPGGPTSGPSATGRRSVTGTRAGAGADPREQGALLRAFELDKAVYEVLYETRSRPSWAPIPLTSIRRLTAAAGSDAGVG